MVVNELRGEKIDIVPFSDDVADFIAKALSPAKVSQVIVSDDGTQANVIVPDHQLSLAIGREGQNARLAARLTGVRIDIRSESQLAEGLPSGDSELEEGVEYAEGQWVQNAETGENEWHAADGTIMSEADWNTANAAVAEALLIGGEVLADRATAARGLELLAFLLRVEIRDGHLSVTPTGGRGPGETGPGFDQQPIEVAALADACSTAYRLTTDPRWLVGISLAWRWFLGDNDSATAMFDPISGAGYDGLQPGGRNLNQGAESTLALLSTAQVVRRAHELR